MPDNEPCYIKFIDKLIDKFTPIHVHDLLVEVNENDIVDAEAAINNILSADRAVYKRNLGVENKRIGVNIEGKNRRHSVYFRGTLFCFVKKCGMTYMHAVKEAQSHRSFSICHIKPQRSFLLS